jgi:hypothetical protein
MSDAGPTNKVCDQCGASCPDGCYYCGDCDVYLCSPACAQRHIRDSFDKMCVEVERFLYDRTIGSN